METFSNFTNQIRLLNNNSNNGNPQQILLGMQLKTNFLYLNYLLTTGSNKERIIQFLNPYLHNDNQKIL
jgi:hypothetical protein